MSCPDCFRGSVLEGEPTGIMTDKGDYFAAGPTGTSKRAVVLLTDIFGLPLKNSKILADSFAERLGCDVWVPDLFNGRPPVAPGQLEKVMPQKAGVEMTAWNWTVGIWNLLPSIPAFIKNRPSVETKKYEQIGTIGYCFGGGIALRVSAKTDIFQSIIVAHPSPPNDADLRAIKAPTAWSFPEDDTNISHARMKQIEDFYAGRKGSADFVEYEVKTFKAHGFAARPNLAYPEVKEGFEQAFKQAVHWFNKTIPA
ncbi:dienelactone hydrolase [Mycena filopes]|nr:dienelactone hydrolase [Mycena filopes]